MAVVAGAVGAYELTKPPPVAPVQTQTMQQTQVVTSVVTAPGTVPPYLPPSQDPLIFDIWPWGTEMVEANAKTFSQEYNDNAVVEVIPGDYIATMGTKLFGGGAVDMLYGFVYMAYRWYKAGWLQTIENAAHTQDAMKEMSQANRENISLPDGKVLGLPYFQFTQPIFTNENMLAQAGLEGVQPKTWDDFLGLCREIKQKGLSDAPYLISLGKNWHAMPWCLQSQCASEGEYLFDENNDPTFDVDTPIADILNMWVTMYKEGLVPQESLTLSETDFINAMCSGKHAYQTWTDYQVTTYNDPASSKIAGYASMLHQLPGKTHDQTLYQALYCITNRPRNPKKLDRLYNLQSFYGWRDINGDLLVSKGWAMSVPPPGQAFPALYQDPEVMAHYKKYTIHSEDIDTILKSYETAKAPKGWHAFWFADWQNTLLDDVSLTVLGQMSVKDCITDLRTTAENLKKTYPT